MFFTSGGKARRCCSALKPTKTKIFFMCLTGGPQSESLDALHLVAWRALWAGASFGPETSFHSFPRAPTFSSGVEAPVEIWIAVAGTMMTDWELATQTSELFAPIFDASMPTLNGSPCS